MADPMDVIEFPMRPQLGVNQFLRNRQSEQTPEEDSSYQESISDSNQDMLRRES